MKTINFKSFEKDLIQEKEMNYLKGGKGDPVEDLVSPPRK
jgi:natural product precursor